MRFVRKWVLPYSVLLGLGFATSIPWLLAVWTDASSSNGQIAVTVLSAMAIAVVGSLVILGVWLLAVAGLAKMWRRTAVWVTFRIVREAVTFYATPVQPLGIAIQEGRLVIRLACGARDLVVDGQRFLVVNSANGEMWGVLEAYRVYDNSCLCHVFDRINIEFWEYLQERARNTPSLPEGVMVTREVPDEEEFGSWLRTVLDFWRSHKR